MVDGRRTGDTLASSSKAAIGTVLEHAATWGLPASPLFMAMLMALTYTPSALPPREANLLYLACMAGALAGCAACLPRRLAKSPRLMRLSCLVCGIVLECAWVVLTVGDRNDILACTVCGTCLVGASTAMLLVMWLGVGQTGSIVCELVKYAVALACAFIVYSLLGIAPGFGWVSFLFPVATCAPLAVRLGEIPQAAGASDRPGRTGGPLGAAIGRVSVALAASVLLAAYGAGLAMLGFGGQRSEYGAGLAALVLASAAAARRRTDPVALVGQLASPLAAAALCYAALDGDGTPFALLLAGCAAFTAWALLATRRDGAGRDPVDGKDPASEGRPADTGRLAPLDLRRIASLLGWATLCAAVGVAVASAAAPAADGALYMASVVLVAVIVLLDVAWRVVAFPTPSRPAGPLQEDAAADESDARRASPSAGFAVRLGRAYDLSPREAEVARLLYENRSASYICDALDLAPSTVKTHVRHIYEKTGVHSRSELQILAEGLQREE